MGTCPSSRLRSHPSGSATPMVRPLPSDPGSITHQHCHVKAWPCQASWGQVWGTSSVHSSGGAPELPPLPTVLMQALLQQTPMHQFLPGLASWGSNLPQAPPTTSPPPPLTLLHPSSTITSVLPHEHHTPWTFPPLKQVDLKYFQHTHTERGDDDMTPHTAVSDLSWRAHLLTSLCFLRNEASPIQLRPPTYPLQALPSRLSWGSPIISLVFLLRV